MTTATATAATAAAATTATATTTKYHIWSSGVKLASISRYLLVFINYFYESTLNEQYII